MPPAWAGTREHFPLPKNKAVFQGHAAAGRYLLRLFWPIYRLEGPPKAEERDLQQIEVLCAAGSGLAARAKLTSAAGRAVGRKEPWGWDVTFLGQAVPSHLPRRRMSPLWENSGGSSCQPQQPPRTRWGCKSLSNLVIRADCPFAGLQPLLGCSHPNSGTRQYPQHPMSSCLAQKDSGLSVSCHNPSDTPLIPQGNPDGTEHPCPYP